MKIAVLGLGEAGSAIAADLAAADRFLTGSRVHTARRVVEMQAATELLAELEVSAYMTQATVQ